MRSPRAPPARRFFSHQHMPQLCRGISFRWRLKLNVNRSLHGFGSTSEGSMCEYGRLQRPNDVRLSAQLFVASRQAEDWSRNSYAAPCCAGDGLCVDRCFVMIQPCDFRNNGVYACVDASSPCGQVRLPNHNVDRLRITSVAMRNHTRPSIVVAWIATLQARWCNDLRAEARCDR